MFMFLPDYTWLVVLPAFFFALWAQIQVQSAYQRNARLQARSGLTGAQAARRLLDEAGLSNVGVELGRGQLTDHYDPRQQVVRLSPHVYQSSSLAALGIAAHETGHALQHAEGYLPLAFRNNLFPVASLGSQLAFPLFILGLIFRGALLMEIGIMLFGFAVLFQLITLPVEFNASRRAIALLDSRGFVTAAELGPTREVLRAAALTYVAAAAVSITQLLRLLMLRERRR